jgi:hypothetical protein
VLLHVAIGSLVPAALYLFAAREFGDRRAALAVGVAFALYPIAIRTSLEVLAQAPFSLCVALSLLALSHARGPSGDWRHAAAAGLGITLAAMFRVEGWVLIPFLALVLWPKRALVPVFVAVAAVGPVLSMVANALHYSDPIFRITAPADIMLNDVGAAELSPAQRFGQATKLVLGLVGGMTPVLALFAGLGALFCLVRRDRQAVWLVPLGGLAAIMLASALRGSLIPKPIYTESLGLLLIPYLAAFLTSPQVQRLPAVGSMPALQTILFGSMLFFLAAGAARDIPELRARSRRLDAVPAIGPVPTFEGKQTLDRILPVIRAHAGRSNEALVVDALGSPATFYLGLHSGHHPDQLYLAPGQPYINLDARLPEHQRPIRERVQPLRDADPPELDGFLRRRCSGLLVLQPGSRLAGWIGFRAPDRASFHGLDLALEELARIPWPLPDDTRLRAADVPDGEPGVVVVFRYSVLACSSASDGAAGS